MKERPILFNTEMVAAILEGRKTETRRIIQPEKLQVLESPYRKEHPDIDDRTLIEKLCLLPYDVGDALWVRETWTLVHDVTGWPHGGSVGEKLHYVYRADDAISGLLKQELRWRPSIHMPKAAARLFLEVTEVYPERLQDITAEDCMREGVDRLARTVGKEFVRGMFSDIWDSTMNAEKQTRYGWDANPWVWVVKFRRIERPLTNER